MQRLISLVAAPYQPQLSAVARLVTVSTDHPLSTEAAPSNLPKRGSAVDACVAAAAMQTVVERTLTSLASVFMVTVYDRLYRRAS